MDIFVVFVLIWAFVLIPFILWLLPSVFYELWIMLWKMPRMSQEERDAYVAWRVQKDMEGK